MKNLQEYHKAMKLFFKSSKGSLNLTQKSRKLGKQIKARGISKNQIVVIVTTYRQNSINIDASVTGRISKEDIAKINWK